MKDLDMLRNCLDAIFHDNVLEARKYLPRAISSLGNHSVSATLYPELVHRVLKFGALMNSEQYDMIVKIMNSALSDREIAAVLLPLVVIIYRVCEHQHVCMYILLLKSQLLCFGICRM